MTIQSKRLLRKIKKAQIDESGEVFVCESKDYIETAGELSDPCVRVGIPEYSTSIHSVLSYLEAQGLIEVSGTYQVYVKATHAGWHLGQTRVTKALQFLTASIIVPIAVSAVTAFLTLWISGSLNNPGAP